ncbi:hypothetical protein [Gemmatimonas sp.]|uniref:hypothetical protein n=1 Tax=Gemmatimonas sp. TaxID=1962908 RepID=UPI0035634A08
MNTSSLPRQARTQQLTIRLYVLDAAIRIHTVAVRNLLLDITDLSRETPLDLAALEAASTQLSIESRILARHTADRETAEPTVGPVEFDEPSAFETFCGSDLDLSDRSVTL